MSMTKGTPESSQIVFLEGRVKELETRVEQLIAENAKVTGAAPEKG